MGLCIRAEQAGAENFLKLRNKDALVQAAAEA